MMMTLEKRIDIMTQLGAYMQNNTDAWLAAKQKAFLLNAWFTPGFIDLAVQNIVAHFLDANKLAQWASHYDIHTPSIKKTVGIVAAGNIPLVVFHDLLSVFISGHRAVIKPSSKDEVLIKHLVQVLCDVEPGVADCISFAERLTNCDAYIATGSNNSSRYFEYYFGKYPNIIRRNRTSAAILTGNETITELDLLADDMLLYFGMGCRNVTKLMAPENYNFETLIQSARKYNYLADHHKYKNNYDYQLALLIMNGKYYMSTDALLLTENESPFTALSQVNYSFYNNKQNAIQSLQNSADIQCIAGNGFIPFGQSQYPLLNDYADGVDTMQFLLGL